VLDTIAESREKYSQNLKSGIHDFVIGVPRKYFYEDLDTEIASAIEKAIQCLAGLAQSVCEVECPVEQDRTVFNAESRAYHRDKMASSAELYDPETLRRLNTGDPISDADYQNALAELRRIREKISGTFTGVDILVTPTVPTSPPGISDLLADISKLRPAEILLLRNTRPVNVWGLPAISIPCGFTSQGLPIGLQIIGPPRGEHRVLRAAYAFEQG